MRLGTAIASMLVIGALHGCAFTTETIDIGYAPQPGVGKIQGAENVSVTVDVADSRPDKNKVSSKKNGYGMETAPILANEEVAATVRRALTQEINARGFKSGNSPADVKVSAVVNRFYNDHKLGFFSGDAMADFGMSVEVRRASGETVFSRTIVSQGTEPNTQLATGNNAKLALDRALASGIKTLFDDPSFLSALSERRGPVASGKSTAKLLDELAADKSLSYDEYKRRYEIIRRSQP
ncbi:YajG family lipoprotein [Pseudomonas putida]